jgi:hypothetical protein
MRIDIATARRLAVKGGVDPRSIFVELAFAWGEKKHGVRGMAGHRARQVLAEEGLLPTGKNARQRTSRRAGAR